MQTSNSTATLTKLAPVLLGISLNASNTTSNLSTSLAPQTKLMPSRGIQTMPPTPTTTNPSSLFPNTSLYPRICLQLTYRHNYTNQPASGLYCSITQLVTT